MESKSYSNKDLAEHYFNVVSSYTNQFSNVNAIPLVGARYRNQKINIEKVQVNLSDYYREHKSFDGLDFKSVGLSDNTKKTLKSILEKDPDSARRSFLKSKKTVNNKTKKYVDTIKNVPLEELYSMHYGDNPLECLTRKEEICTVRSALSRFNPLEQEALYLRYGHEVELSLIAGHLGIGVDRLSHQLNRNSRKLRHQLYKEYKERKHGK